MDELKPNDTELVFLTLAYTRFYDLHCEIMDDDFWLKSDWERFSKIKQAFDIYSEVLNYEPLSHAIEQLRIKRPPKESELGTECFRFVRNVITHFPYFDSWDSIWINKSIINWNRKGLTIDKFLKKYEGHELAKYRFWEERKKRMTYVSICFPEHYSDDSKIFLKNIISEKEGVKFSLILMKKIMETQVVDVKEW